MAYREVLATVSEARKRLIVEGVYPDSFF